MRPVAPIALAAAALVLLGGCAGASTPKPTSTSAAACPSSGSVSKAPKKPSLSGVQRTVLIDGDGAKLKSGDSITWAFTLMDATTQKTLQSSGYGEGQATELQVGGSGLDSLDAALACSTVGSRVVVALPADKDLTSSQASSLGIGADDVLVVVADIVSVVPPLTPKAWTDGVPKVDLSGTTPTIDISGLTAPSDLRLAVLTQGSGTVVKSGDSVTLDYQGVSWTDGKVFDQSFGKSAATFSTSQVVKGFGAALVGQKVGTTLLVSIPPADAYGTDSSVSALANQTLLFLIKIEKTAS